MRLFHHLLLAGIPIFLQVATAQNSREIRSVTVYVSPDGNDSWSGQFPAPNPARTDGPFATFDHARKYVRSVSNTGLYQIIVQFRGGTYFLPATENFTAADSGSPTTKIIYENYPREKPVFSGGMRIQNWTNVGGNKWQATLPASTVYFENLFYDGVRRLRPRLGGYLGAYFRNVGPIYSPAQTPDCSIFFQGSGWEMFRPLSIQLGGPNCEHVEEPRSARGEPLQAASRQSSAHRRYRACELRAVQRFKTSHQLHRRGQ